MQAAGRPPQRAPDGAPLHYERHRPEQTTLYCLVQQHAAMLERSVIEKILSHQRWAAAYNRRMGR